MTKSNIYTRRGDNGTTSLSGGIRVKKNDPRVEAYGTVDELNACIGLLLTYISDPHTQSLLQDTQSLLFTLGAILASPPQRPTHKPTSAISQEHIARLEQAIDATDENLPPMRGFVLPGGSQTAAIAHVCRTVCRRAERRILQLYETAEPDPNVTAYINRLSDYLFVLSRQLLLSEGKQEIIWSKN